MYTREEIAIRFNVHVNTIDKWRKMGMPFIKIRKNVRFDFNDVDKWLKEYFSENRIEE